MASNTSIKKILVVGGSGYVGSHICKEAVRRGLQVSSLNRSGKPQGLGSWADQVEWVKGDILAGGAIPEGFKDQGVVTCVGGFGNEDFQKRINGDTNIEVARQAKQIGVKKFVFISAHDYGFVPPGMRGYFQGKRAAEEYITNTLGDRGTILRPTFISGTRQVRGVNLPLWLLGKPWELVTNNLLGETITSIPGLSLLVTPVPVEAVAKVAVDAATGMCQKSGILSVYDIFQAATASTA
eukprot:TRINITY_DN18947_c0_g1::TRINITY_DN18947_c0_g1_i1::g.21600::m.21600 TRINITY_DN18947_c0_g1::TRINITY_DN18947_c0_g1_i1::g.21600  ORF type:complete len:269 (-),score=33.91,sp/Q9FVR6/Y1222_ARATH/36.50/2e-45,NAD_binding_10/PF13460.1/2e-18,Epimerase/PF01370.16/3e-09,NmrA/PF05368.8/1.1e-08,3Beta_HSD/PF01073.14/3.2e-05,3Beta_HSD/PF01073.14/9.6e+02,NAD_binding_4/PF07993.7/20,NAD_binding_4/PF07993.7/0.5,RmlD_sub_bind/PF04321.12/0.4,RmlD_sub_bind/PF04321.12/1.7e+02,RmlD_sub_bind/PF04321.12/3.6e+02,Polysacc_sy